MKTNKRIPTAFFALLMLSTTSVTLSTMSGCKLFTQTSRAAAGPRYPDTLPKDKILDIQVFRDSTTLRLTNTTTHDFGQSTIWLNQRYSSPLNALASGQTIEMDLTTFVDEFGETFRAGGFFSQRIPAPIVLCQLETNIDNEPQLVGFVVVENNMD